MSADNGVYLKYSDKKLGEEALELVDVANRIIAEYDAQGLDLTLRQLYYQFVARGMIENSDRSYKRLGSVISDGRLVGLIPWNSIGDRTRNLMGHRTFDKPSDGVKALCDVGDETRGPDRWLYRRDLWADQTWRPEVWVEKEALVGVIASICDDLRVNFFACRGYNSQSEQWRAGQRFARYIQDGQRPIVFHLGDHDPSGIDMTRDNRDRLEMFAGTPVMVQRLALNMNQVEELRPPPNPAKLSDARAKDYVDRFGYESWELDALDPAYIRDLIDGAVSRIRDEDVWADSLAKEVGELDQIEQLLEHLP